MTDYAAKLTEQAEALRAFDAGVPSTLPESNRFRPTVESHRWGQHGESPRPNTCPVCARAKANR